jgi:hypothetical protein
LQLSPFVYLFIGSVFNDQALFLAGGVPIDLEDRYQSKVPSHGLIHTSAAIDPASPAISSGLIVSIT